MEIDIITLRLVLIIILAFLIGLEREFNHQPAGLRTHILIGLGSTLLMILSIHIAGLEGNINGDPGRIAAQVVSGIGFIGAGAIIKVGMNTKGITTAANIWVTAAIGLIVGSGMYFVAILATGLILFNLIIITKIKKKLVKPTRYCTIKIDFNKNKIDEQDIFTKLQKLPIEIETKEIKDNENQITIKIMSKLHKSIDIYDIQKQLRKIKNLENIVVSENFK